MGAVESKNELLAVMDGNWYFEGVGQLSFIPVSGAAKSLAEANLQKSRSLQQSRSLLVKGVVLIAIGLGTLKFYKWIYTRSNDSESVSERLKAYC